MFINDVSRVLSIDVPTQGGLKATERENQAIRVDYGGSFWAAGWAADGYSGIIQDPWVMLVPIIVAF